MKTLMGGLHHGLEFEETEGEAERAVMLRPPGDLLSLRYRESYRIQSMSDGVRSWQLCGLMERSPQLEIVDILYNHAAAMIAVDTDDNGHVLKARFIGGKLDGGEPPFELVDELYRNGVLDNLETLGGNGEILMELTKGLRIELVGAIREV